MISGSTRSGAGGKIQLTDASQRLLDSAVVLAYKFEGKCYDRASKLGYLQAFVEYALLYPDLREPLLEYLVREFGQRTRKFLRAISTCFLLPPPVGNRTAGKSNQATALGGLVFLRLRVNGMERCNRTPFRA